MASSYDCQNEIIQIKNKNIFGTQFHPEMSEDGLKLINSFLSLDSFNIQNLEGN